MKWKSVFRSFLFCKNLTREKKIFFLNNLITFFLFFYLCFIGRHVESIVQSKFDEIFILENSDVANVCNSIHINRFFLDALPFTANGGTSRRNSAITISNDLCVSGKSRAKYIAVRSGNVVAIKTKHLYLFKKKKS